MKYSGGVSIAAFLISLILFALGFYNEDFLTKPAMAITAVLPIIGMAAAIFSKKRALIITGLLGNALVFLWAIAIPFASSLFWNTP